MNKKWWLGAAIVLMGIVLILGIIVWERYDYRQLTNLPSNAYLKKHIRKYPVQGIDISHHQGKIDWQKVQHPDTLKQLKFVFIRASVGTEKDQRFKENWKAAGERRIAKGAYHYYWSDVNSTVQAQNFIHQVNLVKGDLPPVLDIEDLSSKQSLASLRKGIKNWIEIVKKEFGVDPIIYTGDRFYLDYLQPDPFFKSYPRLWIANYNNVVAPESSWQIWQFTDRLPVQGIETLVDGNVYKGSLSSFRELLIQ
ncbi:glycoside hydrolase family 25 protein [Nonlabens xiamenensis]|uniref:glycoside hydrolase family 25 protein n=1 Tax=Nonlabens xiamenensis TaxID=2341043 RepID=UPI001F0C3E29|nr:GH25 family lysozyme [Nonlabens xiamenensis]